MELNQTLFVGARSAFEDSLIHRRQIIEDAIALESTGTTPISANCGGHFVVND